MAKRPSRKSGKEAYPATRIATQPSATTQQSAAPSASSRSVNNTLSLVISIVSLLIAGYSAYQATKSASTARESVHVGQRAFLGVQTLTLNEISEGQRASVEVQVETRTYTGDQHYNTVQA